MLVISASDNVSQMSFFPTVYSVGVIVAVILLILLLIIITVVIIVCCRRKKGALKTEKEGVPLQSI